MKISPESYTHMRILGQSWQIIHTPGWLMMEDLGQCQALEQQILLRSGIKGQMAADTLLHEVIHAIEAIYALDLKEEQVRLVATGLTQVFQDNPEFYGWIAERLEEEDQRFITGPETRTQLNIGERQ